MNIKDSYLHSGTHLVKNISFSADSGVVKATITWALEGAENTVIDLPTVGGALFGSQTANYVFAAPNGSNGNPSFRALVAADIPELDASKITSGTITASLLPLATNSAKGAVILGVAKDSTTNITGKLYWVKMNANGKIYVDVPWDTNTHYTAVPVLGASNTTSNATSDTTNAATYLNIVENNAKSGGILITGAGGASVKAKSGLLTITSTWLAANSSQVGYVPKLVSGGTALTSSANDYVLAFTYSSSGTLTPSWKKLPANAYLNNTYDVYNGTYSIKSKVGDIVTTVSDFTANQNDADDFTIILGDNITLTSDTTNRTLTIAANAVNSTLSGVAPQLASGGTELEDSTNDYVLSFTYAEGTLTPSWKKLPAKAYTWRGIQDNLTSSTNTTESLSAKQGYLLANGSARDNTKLPLAGGTMTGPINVGNGATIDTTKTGINFGSTARLGGDSNGNTGIYATGQINLRPNQTLSNGTFSATNGVVIKSDKFTYNGTNVSLEGHKHAYTDLTGSTTTADQAIVSNGTANGWTLKTLGSNAFNSTSYLPLSGGTMTGPIDVTNQSTTDITKPGVKFGNTARIGASSGGIGVYATGIIYLRPNQSISHNNFTYNAGVELTSTTFKYNGNTVYHSGNIPSNSKTAKGVVPAGVASSVYMTDSTGTPSWTAFDTTVTSGSGNLVTSGAVYTAIANNVASAVQYLGTVDSEAAMIALTDAGQGDFARVTTAFTFTDATGASVTAHVGDVVYLTNDTPTTSSNWLVAHTEIDTDTWTAASTSAAGYIPQLATGGASLASSTNDYVLSFVNGTNTTPVWRKLPANAYLNTWTAWVGATSSTDGTAGYMPAPGSANYLKFLRGDGQWIALSQSTHTHSVKINGSTKTIAASGGTAVDLGSYVKLDAGANEQSIKSSIGTFLKGVINLWRSSGDHYTFLGFSNGTTETYLGGIGFKSQSDHNLYKKLGTSYYMIADAANIINSNTIIGITATTIATIAGVNITALLPIAARGESSVTSGVITPTDSGTTKFLREDGTWVEPSYTTNTDKTGIKLTTVSGTKKTDATVIITDSSTGLSIAGGTNKFLIGDGTNYIEVPVTPSITNNVTGSGTSGRLVKWNGANSITNGPALSSAISTLTLSTKFLREDGTWQAPSYTTDTVRPIYTGGTSRYDSATKTGINFVGDGATSVTFLVAGTASGQSGNTAYGTIKISSNNDLVKFSAVANATTEYYLPVRAKNTTDTAQLLYRTGIVVKGNTITADLVGNASTATNLSKGNERGYLYQSGNNTTSCTGVGSVTAQTEIGLPYIGYDGSANTYGIYKDLFYLSGTTKCINTNVHGIRFAEVKTLDSTTDDWNNSTTSGTPTGGGTSYTAGTGISISNDGTISTTRKEYFLTEALFDALTTLDSEAVYYIKAE